MNIADICMQWNGLWIDHSNNGNAAATHGVP